METTMDQRIKVLFLCIGGLSDEPEDPSLLNVFLASFAKNVQPYCDAKMLFYNTSRVAPAV